MQEKLLHLFNSTWFVILQIAIIWIVTLLASYYSVKIEKKHISKLKIPEKLHKLFYFVTKICFILLGISFTLLIVSKFSSWLGSHAMLFTNFSFKISLSFFLLIAAIILLQPLQRCITQALNSSVIDKTLHSLILTILQIIYYLILILIIFNILGISPSVFIAGLSAVGVAFALAVKDNLANITSGLSIILTKPFASNDYIQVGEVTGLVKEINLAYTTLVTYDNTHIFIPNSDLSKSKLINYSTSPIRRLDLFFSIGYTNDYFKAKELIFNVARTFDKLIEDEEHTLYVGMSEQAESAIIITCRSWVLWDNYYDFKLFMLENVKVAFDNNGINIPYKQLDVHLHNAN